MKPKAAEPGARRATARRRSLANVGGEVEAAGAPGVASKLRTALAIDPDPEQGRAHVHGFHSYPARMHPTVARRLVELFAPTRGVVLDPFCGSGTVLVEARLAGREAIGVDLNPLAAALATLKVSGMTRVQAEAMVAAARQIGLQGEQRRKARAGAMRRYPEIDARQFEPHVLLELDSIREGIARSRPGVATEALWLVLSSILTKVSRKRGDTGEVQEQPRRLASGFTLRLFFSKAEELAAQLAEFTKRLPRGALQARVICGDARELPGIEPASVDVVISSPPYPGNYDYLAHHETRLRWLSMNPGALAADEIGARRKLDRIGPRAARAAFGREMAAVLTASGRSLRAGGTVLLVIADSVVAGQVLRADELMVACARQAGLAWKATASQRRPHFHKGTAHAFDRDDRREHVIAFVKTGAPGLGPA
ncbi:MAG: hypothetical protein HY898_28035 [Deltaproteobacteria bacterium]|nr:hypothetical protein [Deltaproteobacteria bacterium]